MTDKHPLSGAKILKLIETVDPADSAALDEIDARVYVFLKLNEDFRTSISGRSITYRHKSWKPEARSVLFHMFDGFRYTRSRDALKAIRPEGWNFHVDATAPECLIDFTLVKREMDLRGTAPTEELAELHAIIQAIQWERDNAR